MPSPFPGMDPYLEAPALWPGLHNGLIAAIQRHLGRVLRPRYFVAIEERTYLAEPEGLALVGVPDVSIHGPSADQVAEPVARDAASSAAAVAVEVPVPVRARETYLEIRSAGPGDVVTVIEILSPSNKTAGEGRRLYLAKRSTVLATRTHLVEIDLLRAGEPMPLTGSPPPSDYRILVSRGDRRPRAELHVFGVRSRIPPIGVPLLPGDEEPVLEVQPLLGELYDVAGYDLRLDYHADPADPLAPEDRDWSDALLRERGLR